MWKRLKPGEGPSSGASRGLLRDTETFDGLSFQALPGQLHQPVEQVELDVAEASTEPLRHHRVEDRVERGVEVEEHAWNRAVNQIPLFSWLNIGAKCDVWQRVATRRKVLQSEVKLWELQQIDFYS